MTRPSYQELADRMDGFGNDLAEIKHAMLELLALKADVETIKDDVAKTMADVAETKVGVAETREIVQAWQAVKIGGKFLKWFGAVAAALVAIIAAVKGGIAMTIR